MDDEFDVEGEEDFDSDEGERARPMFSDDEDEDLEDLNAENMELYSKRLDEEEIGSRRGRKGIARSRN